MSPIPEHEISEHLEAFRSSIAPRVLERLERLYAEAKARGDFETKELLHEAKHCVKESAGLRAALREYADHDNWTGTDRSDEQSNFKLGNDGWEIAEEALEGGPSATPANEQPKEDH